MSRPAPDSARSWSVAALAFTAMFVAVGTGYAYGALVLPLVRDLGIAPGTAAGVFSLTVAVFFLAGAPAGLLADRAGPRPVLALGALALAGGLVTTATAGHPLALFLGHGVGVGAGMAATFVPLTAHVSSAFERHRSLAVGTAVSGIGAGTLVMAPAVAGLVAALGWRTAYLVLAAGTGTVLLGCALVLPRPAGPGPSGGPPGSPSRGPSGPTSAPAEAHPVRSALRSGDFRRLYVAQLLLAVALFIPFAHLPAFAESAGAGPVPAAALVGVVGGASLLGRLALGPVADRVGLLRVYRGCFVAVPLSFTAWWWPDVPYGLLLAHAVVFGVGYGGFVALLPGVVLQRFGPGGLGGVVGVLYTSNVLGAGLGPLAAGVLVAAHGYRPAAVIAAASGLAGAAVLARVRAAAPSATAAGAPPTLAR